MTKTPGQIARQKAADEIIRWIKKGKPLVWIGSNIMSFMVGTAIGQPILSRVWRSPKATVLIHGLRKGNCTAYSLSLTHATSIESSTLTIRFPHRVEAARFGVPENKGSSAEQYLYPDIGDYLMDSPGPCALGSGATAADDSTVAFTSRL
jgi:hypothetical protein